jgi:hypothetical protein
MSCFQVQRFVEATAPTPMKPLNPPSRAASRFSVRKRLAWKVRPTRQMVRMKKSSVLAFMKNLVTPAMG